MTTGASAISAKSNAVKRDRGLRKSPEAAVFAVR